MSRLFFAVALVLATASAKRVKKDTDDNNIWRRCYHETYPYSQCRPSRVEYPLISDLIQTRPGPKVQRILEANDALENLCSEARKFLGCVSNAVKRAPKECRDLYEDDSDFSRDKFNKLASLLELICTDDLITKVRRNLDCVGQADYAFLDHLSGCKFANLQRNCSGIVDQQASEACYSEKFRRICDADRIVQCSADIVTSRCGQEAGEMAVFVGNAFYERFPVLIPECGGNSDFRSFLKIFK